MYPLRSPSKFVYELPTNVIPFFRSFSVRIPLDIHSEHLTLLSMVSYRYIRHSKKHSISDTRSDHSDFPDFSITISCTKMFTNSGHESLRIEIHFRTPGHMSGVRNDLRRKVRHPLQHSLAWHMDNLYKFTMKTRTSNILYNQFLENFRDYSSKNDNDLKQKKSMAC